MKYWRTTKDGALIHDGDCHIWSWHICSCGLLHHLKWFPPEERPAYHIVHPNPHDPDFWDDYGPHVNLLDKIASAEIVPDPPSPDKDDAVRQLLEDFGWDEE